MQLQGDDLNLIKTKNAISAFVIKLLMYKINLGRKKCIQFPNRSIERRNNEDLITYCQHPELLNSDWNKRFKDILKMDMPKWVLDPISDTYIMDRF